MELAYLTKLRTCKQGLEPSCSSIEHLHKPGTTVRRENTRSHSDLDMWNRLAPYVLKLFGRHGQSPENGKVGHQFGEFASTRRRRLSRTNKGSGRKGKKYSYVLVGL
jgi:hypothetical protein